MEVSASFHPQSCFFSGDYVRAIILFSLSPEHPREVVVAWASAQLHCECVTAEGHNGASNVANGSGGGNTFVGGATSPTGPASLSRQNSASADLTGMSQSASLPSLSTRRGVTSMRPVDWIEGAQIMSSAPKVLFCELHLWPGEKKVFTYHERLPADLPPSHRGRRIRINYNLLVGIQTLSNASVSVLKEPFRVLSHLSGGGDCAVNGLLPHSAVDGARANPRLAISAASPFLRHPSGDVGGANDDGSPMVMLNTNPAQILTPRGRPAVYDISTASSGCLARLAMPKKAYKLGEEIMACLSFPTPMENASRCIQYSVALVYTETVSLGTDVTSQSKVARFHDFAYGVEESFFSLEVPHNVTPTFSTATVQLRWHLHFEFVVSPPQTEAERARQRQREALDEAEDGSIEWNAPRSLDVRTLEWDLPVVVASSDPMLIGFVQSATAAAATSSSTTGRPMGGVGSGRRSIQVSV